MCISLSLYVYIYIYIYTHNYTYISRQLLMILPVCITRFAS